MLRQRAKHALMSTPVLVVTVAVLILEAAVLFWWMLVSVACGIVAPALGQSPTAPLLGRLTLVLTAAVMASFAVAQIRSWT